mmetsp:Transcript_11643/g.27294  ORF Transcript_11643/g.27294 Transcript_11643/m.27294 type:complete len:401 (-) Transcript_11643:460-1662(-)
MTSIHSTHYPSVGSEVDHKVKEAAAQGEEAWEGVGEEAGVRVWRIEQFKVVPWPEEQYGQFFKGDSYIVLHSYVQRGETALLHDVHIWIGSDSSQDEYGTAAYKMVEADEFLGGAAVQHRQVEGLEADEFVDLFDLVEYFDGGVASGFTKVEPTVEKPLFFRYDEREGSRSRTLVQVPLSIESMQSTHGFILFADPSKVWAWHGSEMRVVDKVACTSQGEKLCTLGTVKVLGQGWDDTDDEEFWSYLRHEADIDEADVTEDSTGAILSRSIGITPRAPTNRKSLVSSLTTFRPKMFLVPAEPTAPLEELGVGSVVQKAMRKNPMQFLRKPTSGLDESDVYLIDTGWKIFVWIGKDADPGEKVAALGAADRYAAIEPRANELPVTVLKSGQERGGFRSFFR